MELFRYVFIFILSLLGTYFLTPVFRRLAIKIDLLDRPNPRKIHSEPIPIAGDLAFYLYLLHFH